MTTTQTTLISCLMVLACGCHGERPAAPERAVLEVVAPADVEERKQLAMSVIRELSGHTIRLRTARRLPHASTPSLEALRVAMLTESKPTAGEPMTRVYLVCEFDPAFVRAEGGQEARRTEARDVLDACRTELQQTVKASGEPRGDDRRG